MPVIHENLFCDVSWVLMVDIAKKQDFVGGLVSCFQNALLRALPGSNSQGTLCRKGVI